jgi:hypothetical protein
MNVKFPAHQQPNCWCEPCICLHYLWRLFLNNERTAIYKHIINKLTFMFNSHHGAAGQQPRCIYNLGRTSNIYSAASFTISELQGNHNTMQTITKPCKPATYDVWTCSYNVRFKVLTSELQSFKSSRMWRVCSHRYVVSNVTKDNNVFIFRVKQSKTKKIYTVWPCRPIHCQLSKYEEWHTQWHSLTTHKTWIFKITIRWHSGELKFYFSVKPGCIWSTIHSLVPPTTQLQQFKFNVCQLSSI